MHQRHIHSEIHSTPPVVEISTCAAESCVEFARLQICARSAEFADDARAQIGAARFLRNRLSGRAREAWSGPVERAGKPVAAAVE